MALQSWQIMYILGVIIGLLMGWRLHPWLGTAFIWVFIITFEVFIFLRRRGRERGTKAEHHRA
jgi:cytochrome b subunit of formate dehydrogenase